MEITHKRRARLPTGVAQFLLGTAGIALITLVCFRLHVGVARTGFAYVILIALASVLGSFAASVALSIVAAACLNFFFAPPLFELRIDASDDLMRIAAFLTTSLVIAALTTRLSASEARFRTFVDHAIDGFFVFDEHQAIRDVNRQACESLGYSREQMIGMHSRDFDAGLDAPAIARIGERVTAGETVTFETLHRRKDGSTFPVEVRARRFPHGAHRWRLSLARDITERKRTEDELRRNQARLEHAQRIAHFGWWERDFTSGHVTLSDEVCQIFGLHAIDLPDWHGRWLNLIHPEDRPRVADAAAAALARDGPRYDVEYRVVRPDGGERTIHSQGDVTRDETGRPVRQFGVLQDITELRQAEQELRTSEARFRTIVDYASDAFLVFDDSSTVRDVNREACRSLGYSREELIGKHRADFDAALDEETIEGLKQRLVSGEPITFETRHRRKDGTTFPVEVRVGDFQQGGERRYLCLVRDITERKQAEETLRRNETYLAAAESLSKMGSWAWRPAENKITHWSQGRYHLFGFDPADGIPSLEAVLERIHPDDRALWLENRSVVACGGESDFDFRIVLPDGGTKHVHAVGRPILNQSGEVVEVMGAAADITDRKRAEDELRESEERFRTLVRFSFDVYWESDTQHRFTRQEFGADVADAPAPGSEIGKTRWEVPYLEPDEGAWCEHRATLDAHLPFRDFELARPTPEGGKRYVSVSGLPVFDKTGAFVGYRGVGRHITERKRAEEALRRSEAYLAGAQELSQSGAFAHNLKENLYWSEGLYRIWGLDPSRGLPSREACFEQIHPDDRDRVRRVAEEAIAQKQDYTIEYRIVLPEGTLKHLRSTCHPSYSPAGELVEVIGTAIDVTERKRAQEEHERLRKLEADLAHVNRLSMMGELTASLAHEILHPIATARNNARAAIRFLDKSPPNMIEVRAALESIVRDADRGKDIVDRIRDHVKKAPPRNDRFDLNGAISEVIVMVRAAIDKNHVSVRTHLAPDSASISGDRVQLQQVIMNLVLNAVEAMAAVEEGARTLSVTTDQNGGGGILVAVRDSGPGIDQEHLQKVFERFYTTKDSGVGMGLAICRSIIEAHGGRLWAEPNQPRGAVFQFTLPAVQQDS